ncbi:MAG: phosphoglycerate dehydrogenase [Oceanococcaceae bacterium]
MFKVLTLNNISTHGLDRLPRKDYEVASDMSQPDAILLRSADMHSRELPSSLLAVGRAGAGTNNIPVAKLAQLGIPVFNAPGANANAVKELVLAGMFMAARNIPQAYSYVRGLEGSDEEVEKQVEAGKKTYAGFELPGKTLGVIGLGAIGIRVANAAQALGMRVLGYDPSITVKNAWQLNAGVEQAVSVDDLFSRSDFLTVHVPLVDGTRNLVNAERIKLMRKGGVVLNFARGGVVDEAAVLAALDSGKLGAFVTDFPTNQGRHHPKVIALPHLGASTAEAEDNCAVMVADQVRDYLETGTIRNAVNFPEAELPFAEGVWRLAIANANKPNMVGQMSSLLGEHGLNIHDLLNKSRGELAYTLVDVDSEPAPEVLEAIRAVDGVLKVRLIPARETA